LSTGNDSDGEEKPTVPVKTVDKVNARTGKRNVEPQAPVRGTGAGGNRRGGGLGGNDGGEYSRIYYHLDERNNANDACFYSFP
jgi:plasminogen activator inhibitor 1 RNA-binding protein